MTLMCCVFHPNWHKTGLQDTFFFPSNVIEGHCEREKFKIEHIVLSQTFCF